MSVEWNDLVSQSDIFFTLLPLYKGDALQDKIEGNLTTKFDGGKFSFNAATTNGKLATKVSGKECFKSYWGIELAGKLQNKPANEVSVKLGDKLIPLANTSVTVKAAGNNSEETLSAEVKYADEDVVGSLGFSVANPLLRFGYAPKEKVDAYRPKLTYSVLANIYEDVFVGLKGNYSVPKKEEKPLYDLSMIGAIKNNDMEAGLYQKVERKKVKDELKFEEKVGLYASVKKENLLVRVQAAHKHNSNQEQYRGFSFTAGVATKCGCATYVGQVQVAPDTTLSVGWEKKVSKNLKLSLGYAHVVAFGDKSPKQKDNAFSFKLDLTH